MELSEVSTFEDALFNEDLFKSTQNSDILLKQYEVYVELMDRVYERRSKVNTFYLSLNSILLTGLAAFLSQAISPQTNYAWILVAVSAGIVFCIIWRRAILSSKALIVAKYKVIHILETRLPARLFEVEWDIVKQDRYKYTPFSDIEGIIPLVFVGAYTVIALLSLAQLLT